MCQVQNSKTYLEKQQELMHTSLFIQYNSKVLLLVSLWVSLGQKMSCRHLLPPCSQKVCKIWDKKHCLTREQPDSYLGYGTVHQQVPQQEINFPNWDYFLVAKEKTIDGISYIHIFFHIMGEEKKERINRLSGMIQTYEKYVHIYHLYVSAVRLFRFWSQFLSLLPLLLWDKEMGQLKLCHSVPISSMVIV